MDVLLLRHSRTAGNAAGRYIGRTDEPLSNEGLALARALPPDQTLLRVTVTPLVRTRQTATILFPMAEQIIVPALREMDFGAFEGRTADEMACDAEYRAWVAGGCTGACPGGESAEGFAARVCPTFAEALACEQARGETRAAFVLHGGAIMAIMAACALPEKPFYEWNVGNCCGYRAIWRGTNARGLPLLTEVAEVNAQR